MKITLNNLLTESLIDDIPSFTKMDKAILKFLHQNTPIPGNQDYWVNVDSYKVWDLMKTFGLTDGDYIFKMWKIYKKYNDILFNDLTDIGKYDPSDYDVAADVIIMNYYINNIVGKMIYPGWRVELLESMEVMISEDMITMEIRHVTYPPTIFVDLNLSDMKRRHRVSIELMSMDEEGWGQDKDHPRRGVLLPRGVRRQPPQVRVRAQTRGAVRTAAQLQPAGDVAQVRRSQRVDPQPRLGVRVWRDQVDADVSHHAG